MGVRSPTKAEQVAPERPILFSDPMVRAILDGRKTQTRRIVRPQPPASVDAVYRPFSADPNNWQGYAEDCGLILWYGHCQYGQPGDRLVVKETYYAWGRWETRFSDKKGRDEWHFVDMTLESGKSYFYAADGLPRGYCKHHDSGRGGITPRWWKRPAIFMPKHASRIDLEITAVRVERLHDISETDARTEGVHPIGVETGAVLETSAPVEIGSYSAAFADLWESIHNPGSWEANPWVWVIEFRRIKP